MSRKNVDEEGCSIASCASLKPRRELPMSQNLADIKKPLNFLFQYACTESSIINVPNVPEFHRLSKSPGFLFYTKSYPCTMFSMSHQYIGQDKAGENYFCTTNVSKKKKEKEPQMHRPAISLGQTSPNSSRNEERNLGTMSVVNVEIWRRSKLHM
jgi:hypothetical protein